MKKIKGLIGVALLWIWLGLPFLFPGKGIYIVTAPLFLIAFGCVSYMVYIILTEI